MALAYWFAYLVFFAGVTAVFGLFWPRPKPVQDDFDRGNDFDRGDEGTSVTPPRKPTPPLLSANAAKRHPPEAE
jgi:hypothetical protein